MDGREFDGRDLRCNISLPKPGYVNDSYSNRNYDSNELCRDFQRGGCYRERCKYLHADSYESAERNRGGSRDRY